MSNQWYKDPSDVLEYKFDFAPLENGSGDSNFLDRDSSPIESISSETVTVDSGVTLDAETITNNGSSVTVKLSGGTAGEKYKIMCEVVTSSGQTKQITAILHVSNQ